MAKNKKGKYNPNNNKPKRPEQKQFIAQKQKEVKETPQKPKKPSEFYLLLKMIWGTPQYKRFLLGGLLLNIILFIVYKTIIPYPDFFTDSHSYIYAAENHLEAFYRPSGYPHFLNLVHNFSSSAYFLVLVQYLLLNFSVLFFYFSIIYLLNIDKNWIKYTLFVLIVINPSYLVLSNQVGSDTFFTAFTFVWFSSLLWFLKKGTIWSIILQAIAIYLCFNSRYNAMCYIFVTVLAILLASSSKISKYLKLFAIGLSVFMVGVAYFNAKDNVEKETGATVFEGFSGWGLANTALLIYNHSDNKDVQSDDPNVSLVSQFVKQNIDSALTQQDKEALANGDLIWPMWNKSGPLKKYLSAYCQKEKVSYISGWYQVSPFFKQYGKSFILNNLGAYTRFFIFPNIKFFFYPKKEDFSAYLANGNSIPQTTQTWFDWHNVNTINTANTGIHGFITNLFLPIYLIVTLFTFIGIIFFGIKFKKIQNESKFLLAAVAIFYLVNAAFSVISNPIVIRYQIAPFAFSCAFLIIYLNYFLKERSTHKTTELNVTNPQLT